MPNCPLLGSYINGLLDAQVLPEDHEPKEMIGYYQWVPLILLCQALLFYLPCMVWRFLNNKAGIDVNNIVEAAFALQHTAYAESRDKTVRYMVCIISIQIRFVSRGPSFIVKQHRL